MGWGGGGEGLAVSQVKDEILPLQGEAPGALWRLCAISKPILLCFPREVFPGARRGERFGGREKEGREGGVRGRSQEQPQGAEASGVPASPPQVPHVEEVWAREPVGSAVSGPLRLAGQSALDSTKTQRWTCGQRGAGVLEPRDPPGPVLRPRPHPRAAAPCEGPPRLSRPFPRDWRPCPQPPPSSHLQSWLLPLLPQFFHL